MLYFAYGSNLNHFQMKKRCKDSKYLKRIDLKDFKLNVEVLVQAYRINSESNKKFTIVRSIDYSVSSRHSGTLENEKDALERLTGQISDKILERLFSELNDN